MNRTSDFPVKDIVIRASAGTGKTFQLSNRYLRLLRLGASPDEILASTFARKAAGEIQERILLRLAAAANDEGERAQLESLLECGPLTRRDCAAMLEDLIRHLHRLRVETLDSFFVKTATSFALELGLPTGWTILEDLDDRALRLEAVRTLLSREMQGGAELLTLIGMLQQGDSARDVVKSLLGTVNEFYAVFREAPPEAWHVWPQYARLSPEEFEDALERLSALGPFRLKSWNDSIATSITACRNEAWETVLLQGISGKVAAGETTYRSKSEQFPPELVEAIQPLVDQARAEVLGAIAHRTEATRKLLEKYHAIYHPLKLRHRGLRFEDVTQILAGSLDGRLDRVSYRLDASLAHLLLDEFQDTSLAQWQVLHPFASDVNGGDCSSFFCVGDVKQAIYGWRGGVSEIFDRVTAELQGIEEQPLTESFRSSPPVIGTVNQVFTTLHANPSLEDYISVVDTWRTRFEPHSTRLTKLHGYCTLETAPLDEEGKFDKNLLWDHTADRVAELHARYPGCSIGVLTRTNKAVAQLIYRLRHREQPVFASEEGGNPLTDSAAVQYILSLLRLADHPGDTVSRFHVARSPLGPVVGFTDFRDEAAALELSHRIRRQLLADGYGRTVYGWVTGLAPVCDDRELNRLLQLVELAWGYQPRATLSAGDFVDFLEVTKVEDPSSSDVRVMTVHQSKGLQFDIVVLPELEGTIVTGRDPYLVGRESPTEPISRVSRYFSKELLGLVPDSLRRMHDEQRGRTVNEALCLLYVALTRAVHALHMIVPASGKPTTLTAARILLNALAPGEPEAGETLFETGDPQWYEHEAARFQPKLRQAATPEPLPPIQLASGGPRRRRNLERVSPSAHEGAGPMRLADVLQVEQSTARLRGSLIHAWFETVTWIDAAPPDRERLEQQAGRFRRPELDIDAELQRFLDGLESDELRANLTLAEYRRRIAPQLFPELADDIASGAVDIEVHSERRIAFRDDRRLVDGIVDRLVLFKRDGRVVAADVVDYKTDTVASPADVDAAVERYRGQLELYAEGVHRIYRVPPEAIVLRLALVAKPEFVTLGRT